MMMIKWDKDAAANKDIIKATLSWKSGKNIIISKETSNCGDNGNDAAHDVDCIVINHEQWR